MPNVSVTNLYSGALVVPGGYYANAIQPGATATFDVIDTDEFVNDPRVEAEVTAGRIRIVLAATDTQDRPFPSYPTATLPAANAVAANTVMVDSTTGELVISDGTAWTPVSTPTSGEFLAGATSLAANRFVGINTSGTVDVSPAATERWLGVTQEAITNATFGKVQLDGIVDIMAAANITANDEVICVPGGMAATFQASAISLGTAVAGADVDDDLTQTNLPDTVQAICAGSETGSMIIYGNESGGTYTEETVSLVGGAGTYTSLTTFDVIYCIEMTAAAVGTIDVEDGTGTAAIIPTQIAALAAARKYGAIVPDVSTDPKGQVCQIKAGGANATDVVLYGTDYLGAAQSEVVTMNGTTWVDGTLPFASLTHVFIGADGIAWNAGVTSQYDQQVEANERNEIRGYAVDDITGGTADQMLLFGQNTGRVIGEAPVPFHTSLVSWGGGGVTTTATVYGVLATDAIQATLNSSTNAVTLDKAERTAADTITLTFSADPGAATTVALSIWRV